jgi:hypothetical protein
MPIPTPSLYQSLNLLAAKLANEHQVPAPPPLSYKQVLKTQAQILRNGLTREEYLQAADQLWRTVKRRHGVFPKPYLLISPSVIQLALSNQMDHQTNTLQTEQAIQTTLDDWLTRYREAHPAASIREAIGWLEWDGVHRQFPPARYSSWKKQKNL